MRKNILKLNKIISLLSLSVIVGFTLVGCSNLSNSDKEKNQTSTNPKNTINSSKDNSNSSEEESLTSKENYITSLSEEDLIKMFIKKCEDNYFVKYDVTSKYKKEYDGNMRNIEEKKTTLDFAEFSASFDSTTALSDSTNNNLNTTYLKLNNLIIESSKGDVSEVIYKDGNWTDKASSEDKVKILKFLNSLPHEEEFLPNDR